MELKVLINCFREQIRYNVKIPYNHKLDELLSTITVSDDIINCYDLQCDRHYTFIESFQADIMSAMINAAKDIIPYTVVLHCTGSVP